VTPKSFRLRKKLLTLNERSREQKKRDMALA
jgi:predicted membrane GTPase involved in stress response